MPQNHAAYPTSTDLTAFITSLNLFDSADLSAILAAMNLAQKADAAAEAWETATGWHPFLADAATSTRRFDPPGPNKGQLSRGGGRRLYLQGGIITVPTVVVGYTATSPGSTLVYDQDFWLLPQNAAERKLPWEWVEFGFNQSGPPRSVQVTAKWGYQQYIPDHAWQMILEKAAFLCLPELETQSTGGTKSFTEGGTTESYGPSGILSVPREVWEKRWEELTSSYVRLDL
jgi:hypothetical protein